jgi:hypothetical protein
VGWDHLPHAQSRPPPRFALGKAAAQRLEDQEREDIKQTELRRGLVEQALDAATDWDARARSAIILDVFARDVLASKAKAERTRRRWIGVQRGGGAVTAAVASLSAAAGGGALTAHASGTTALVLGLVLLVLGGLGAGATALGSEYQRSRKKRRMYTQLWWDVWDYATFQLPTEPLDRLRSRHDDFMRRWEPIGE